MTIVRKVVRYQMSNVARSRWLVAYAMFFLLVSEGLLRFSGDVTKTALSLINVVLFIVPLVALVFGTVYLYNAREFTELLLAQPVRRWQLYTGLYLGLTLPLVAAFVVGLAAPFAVRRLSGVPFDGSISALLVAGSVLTAIFTGIATLVATWAEDRLRGLGVAIGVWLLLTVVYDGFVLFVLAVFADYPLERATLALMMTNPIDVARVALLLRFDAAALMGYTGAVFEQFFSGATGVAVTVAALALWASVPALLGARVFQRKDF